MSKKSTIPTPDADGNVVITAKEYNGLAKRAKDNRDAFLKSSNEKHTLTKQNSVYEKLFDDMGGLHNLSPTELGELNDLKYSDPDKWLATMNDYKSKSKLDLTENLKKAKADGKQEAEEKTNKQLTDEFLADNTGLTQDNLDNDVPFGLKNSLDTGEITIEEFLSSAKAVLTPGETEQTNKSEDTLQAPNFANLPGGNEPDKEAVNNKTTTSYEESIF